MGLKNKLTIELNEETFCELVDSIEEYWRFCLKLDDAFEANVTDSRLCSLMDKMVDFLVNSFYEVDEHKRDPYWCDDITYYMWELDFGKKWAPGMVIIDEKDIPLCNSHDLWKLICSNMEEE